MMILKVYKLFSVHKLILCIASVIFIFMRANCTIVNDDLSIEPILTMSNISKNLHAKNNVVNLDGMIDINDTFVETTYKQTSRHDTPETSFNYDTLHKPVSTFSQKLIPFAKRGDMFDLRISSACKYIIFEPVEFTNLTFDQSTLSVAHPHVSRTLNLTMCAIHNCTGEIRVEWEMKGQQFASSTALVHFYPHTNAVKHRLVGHKKEPEESKSNLSSASVEGIQCKVYHSYIQQTLILSPIVDFTSPLPPQAHSFTPSIESSNYYGPAVYINNFWQIRDHMYEFNTSSARDVEHLVNLTVDVMPIALWKVLIYEQYELSLKQQQAMGLASANDAEDTKRIFLETNPYFLALTALVTVLHMIFEYLAFSNDVKFWRGRKNFKGLSLRSILINCYFQSIIFLYLLDSQETSWAILLPSGIGVITEFWKLAQIATVTRATNVPKANLSSRTIASENTTETTANDNEYHVMTSTKTDKKNEEKVSLESSEWRIFGYTFSFKDSYDARTRRHDETAVRYLIYIMIPILLAYSVYSAVFDSHKSWYSFLIGTQVRFIYFFGFAMMTPQIFINYKMKSVGQMPWRMFVYKALNTVIDDLFAFIIKMPLLHRIACFRDDVVFVILLYQRWIYPVDQRRIGDDNNDDDDDNDDNDNENDGNVNRNGTNESDENINADDNQNFTEYKHTNTENVHGGDVDGKQNSVCANSTNPKAEAVTPIATSKTSLQFNEKKRQESEEKSRK